MKRYFSLMALAFVLASCSGASTETAPNEGAPVVQAAETITLSISGMDCDGCVQSVTEALKGVEGVAEVEVSLEEQTAVVKGSTLDVLKLAAAVDEAGYGATPFDPNATPAESDSTHSHEADSTHSHHSH